MINNNRKEMKMIVDLELDRDWFIINHADESEFDYILSQLGYHSSEREEIEHIMVKVDTDFNETT